MADFKYVVVPGDQVMDFVVRLKPGTRVEFPDRPFSATPCESCHRRTGSVPGTQYGVVQVGGWVRVGCAECVEDGPEGVL